MPLPISSNTHFDKINTFFNAYTDAYTNNPQQLTNDQTKILDKLITKLANFDIRIFTTFEDEDEFENFQDFADHNAFSEFIDCEIIYFGETLKDARSYSFTFLKSQFTQIEQIIASVAKELRLFHIYHEFTNRNKVSDAPLTFYSTALNATYAFDGPAYFEKLAQASNTSGIPDYSNIEGINYPETQKLLNKMNQQAYIQEIANSPIDRLYPFDHMPLLAKLADDKTTESILLTIVHYLDTIATSI